MRNRLNNLAGWAALFLLLPFCGPLRAAPVDKLDPDVRCAICGMFVAKYDNWIVQIHSADSNVMFFDGVKDMMVFYFSPQQYSSMRQEDITEIWVKDYYTLQWLDARRALYVIGSDIYGPMGKEFVPFSSKEGADNFLQDHQGNKILTFDEISDELVQSMRFGSKMRHDTK